MYLYLYFFHSLLTIELYDEFTLCGGYITIRLLVAVSSEMRATD